MKSWFAIFVILAGCTNLPQEKTSEQKLAEQAKAIELAADKLVDDAVADFDVNDAAEDASNSMNSAAVSNQSK